MDKSIPKNEEIEKNLTPEQVDVMRRCGTEAPGSGKWLHNKDTGMYVCAACGTELFQSDAKFDSGTGWPSFDEAANRENIELLEDRSMGMSRTEVRCKHCGSHLGHLFEDGPTATGQRFCINSVALDFKKK